MDNCPTNSGKKLIPILKQIRALRFSLAGLIMFSALYGCGNANETFGTVHGSITSVHKHNEQEIKSFAIEDTSGNPWVFHTTGIIDFNTPDHLEWHMTNNQAIKVFYERTPSTLIAINILDYP
jgi:hypothetical protein